MEILIKNLPMIVETAELTKLFEEFGCVLATKIEKDLVTGDSTGFATVTMSDIDAIAAVKAMNGKNLDGNVIMAKISHRHVWGGDTAYNTQKRAKRHNRPIFYGIGD